MMKLCIYKEIDCRLPLKNIKFLFGKLTKIEAKDNWNGIINLIFTSDERMKSLNKQFRAKNRTTDVLSFNIDEPVSDESVFGEIYISVFKAKEQAQEYGETFSKEIIRLACHGSLHLFGYDHIKKKDLLLMKERENYYLNLVSNS